MIKIKINNRLVKFILLVLVIFSLGFVLSRFYFDNFGLKSNGLAFELQAHYTYDLEKEIAIFPSSVFEGQAFFVKFYLIPNRTYLYFDTTCFRPNYEQTNFSVSSFNESYIIIARFCSEEDWLALAYWNSTAWDALIIIDVYRRF